jgi:guanylate kinase
LPPSFEVLRARLTARATEGVEDLDLRLRNSVKEVMDYSKFRYAVMNDDIATASRKLAAIILAERLRTDRQSDVLQGILDSFAKVKL